MTTPYEQYVRAEWEKYLNDPTRAKAIRDVLKGRSVGFVLDVGCGAGQELLTFTQGSRAFGIGLDISPEVGCVGRELFQKHAPQARVVFVRSRSEQLPFADQSFDVLVNRLSIPYTDNRRTLAEFARVLKPGGILFLKIHHARYYLSQLSSGIRKLDIKAVIHASRVLVNGSVYFLTGRQPRNNFLGRETFKTTGQLKMELAALGLSVRAQLPDSNPRTPSFVIDKR